VILSGRGICISLVASSDTAEVLAESSEVEDTGEELVLLSEEVVA
jgi:hypothetical protein